MVSLSPLSKYLTLLVTVWGGAMSAWWQEARCTGEALWSDIKPGDNSWLYTSTAVPDSQSDNWGHITKGRVGHGMNMSCKGMTHVFRKTEWLCDRFHHSTQNCMQFKTYRLFIFIISHIIFWVHSSLVPEIAESKTIESIDGHIKYL